MLAGTPGGENINARVAPRGAASFRPPSPTVSPA
jgi:hypothetical protein